MQTPTEIFNRYKAGFLGRKEASNELMEVVFRNRVEYGLIPMDEDNFSDFLVFMTERLEFLLDKYKPSLGTFDTYFRGIFTMTFFWWKKKVHSDMENSVCCQNICVEESLAAKDFSPQEKDFYEDDSVTENLMTAKVLALTAQENLNLKAFKTRKFPVEEVIKVLALKSCNDISEKQIEAVSELTGMDATELLSLVMQAEDTLTKKKFRLSQLESRRNFAYYHRKKRLLRKQSLLNFYNQYFEDPKKDIHEKRWLKTMVKVRDARQNLAPSNETVGRLLNISPRKVSAIVSMACGKSDDKSEDGK